MSRDEASAILPIQASPADISAGNKFRETLIPRADAKFADIPLWYGWALMDAFLAGAEYGRANPESNLELVTPQTLIWNGAAHRERLEKRAAEMLNTLPSCGRGGSVHGPNDASGRCEICDELIVF
jgi:hypothetical protein